MFLFETIHLNVGLCVAVRIDNLLQAHRNDARAEREKYYKHLLKSSAAKGNPKWWKYTTMIIDGMTQRTTQLPHFRRMPSWVKDNKALIDTHCMGILIEGVGRFMEFNFSHNYSDNSNYLANVIHRAVERVHQHRRSGGHPLPEVLYLQLDNVSSNKSHFLIAYCALLVKRGVFRKVKINYLIVGHTHENIDQMFSRFAVALRRLNVWDIEHLMEVARNCFKDGVVPECQLIDEVHDIKGWMHGCYNEVRDVSFQHCFKIFSGPTGDVLVQAKRYSFDPFWLPKEGGVKVFKSSLPEGSPCFVEPKSINEMSARKQAKQLATSRKSTSTPLKEIEDLVVQCKRNLCLEIRGNH
jgi:hypothetical protein